MLAHGGLRLALQQASGTMPTGDLPRTGGGKPHWRGGADFSLSYCGDEAWVAVSTFGPVGLDVVRLDRDVRLSDDIVSPADRAALAGVSAASANIDAVAWAIKEAAAKLADAVDLPPAGWRIRSAACFFLVHSDHYPPVAVELRETGAASIAALARWGHSLAERACP